MIDVELETILAEISEADPHCVECDAPMPSALQWKRAGDAERQELMDEGYARPGRRGLCAPCHRLIAPADRPAPLKGGQPVSRVTQVRMAAILHNRDEYMRRGWTSQEACDQMGVSATSVDKAVERRKEAA